jgi:acyl-CoA dehydrogenase
VTETTSDTITLDHEEARVRELCAELLAAHPPASTDPVTFLGAQYDAGLGWVHFPEGQGGMAASRRLQQIVDKVLIGAGAPNAYARNPIGHGMGAPTIVSHGTDAQRARYLRPLFTGEEVWCQLFSEPGAGSDLAGLSTRAELDGDEWVLNGQKVWTSGAQYSDIGEIICRTDPDLPKHKGLTGFIVDMHAPGVEVRPLRQMTGGASFNEVFFNEVKVPDDHRLGDVNQGWSVALTTLMNERSSIGAGGGGGGMGLANVTRLAQMLRHFGYGESAVHRDQLMDLYTRFQVAKYTNQRALDKIKAGQLPGPEMSIAKMALTDNLTRTSEFVASVLGPRLVADTGEWGTYAWSQFVCGTPGMRIAGGSDEVLRNIVGERVLGLPREPDPFQRAPWREIPRS